MTPPEFMLRLGLFDSRSIFPVGWMAPGIHTQKVSTEGNSILSTIWVKSLDPGAKIKVEWYDIGPGSGDFIGERVYLASHPEISLADTSDRRIVPRLHNKAYCQVTITGGNVEFGIYVTVVSAFPQIGPYFDGQDVVIATDSANGLAIYDKTDGKWYLAQGPNGALNANIVGGSLFLGPPGTIFRLRNKIIADGTYQNLISETVPSGKIWRLLQTKFLTRCYGEGDIIINGSVINSALTGPAENNVVVAENPYEEFYAGETIEVNFKKNYGPLTDISAIAVLTSIDEP